MERVARMEPTGPARSGRPDDRLRAVRGLGGNVVPGFCYRSTRAALAAGYNLE
jgi:hypothetical protein